MDVASVRLRSRQGRERTVDDLTTLFDLFLVVIDVRRPSSYERLLAVVERIDKALSGADCTVGVVLVAADETDVDRVLGPLARQLAVFVDPEAQAATALGLSRPPHWCGLPRRRRSALWSRGGTRRRGGRCSTGWPTSWPGPERSCRSPATQLRFPPTPLPMKGRGH